MSTQEDQFKFEVDTNQQADPFPEQVHRLKARSSGVPILLIMVLILMLAMGAGFYYLNHRFTKTYSSAIEVSSLSQKLENHFSSLSVKQARLEAALETVQKELTTKFTEIEQVNHALNQKLDQQNEASQQAITQKIGPEELNSALAVAENKMGKIDARLSDLTDQSTSDQKKIEDVEATVTGQLNEFEGILNETAKGVIDLKTDLANVVGSQLDKNAIDQIIKRQITPTIRRIAEFNAATEALTNRLQTLQKRITDLKKNSDLYEREILKLRSQMNDLQRQFNARPLPTEKVQ